MTNIGLVFTCNNRPEFLTETLESWAQVRGLDAWRKWIFVEPSTVRSDVLSVINNSGLELNTVLNDRKHGVLHNPWVAIDAAFSEGCDFVVLAEDDIIVSSDTVEYFTAACNMFSPVDTLGVSAYSANPSGDPSSMLRIPHFWGLLWGTWKECWYEHLRDTWDHDYSTHNGISGVESGWDWNINTRIMPLLGKDFVAPEVSRSRHIGRYGEHVLPQDFDSVAPSPSFEQHREPMIYHTS
jgi:hypothetical protein